ncbi:MAG: thermonuclease family protein [Nitrospinae bacterium]|nr:thermonuclease family protein [Nitrospinota bacterium]
MLLVYSPNTSHAQPETEQNLIWGKVIRVYDGDTVAIKDDKGQTIRVQLAYIDAPDMDYVTNERQPLFKDSMDALSRLVMNQEVIIEALGKDSTGKTEGMIFLDKLNVNVEMVRRGLAEIYEPVRSRPAAYNREYVDQLKEAEETAKADKAGVWGRSDYISPYKYRRRHGGQ